MIIDKCKDQEVYISNGWIDSHVHLGNHVVYSLDKSNLSVFNGIAAAIDAGTSGVDNIKENMTYNENPLLKIFYLLNVSSEGLTRKNELNNPSIDFDAINQHIKEYKNIIGLKIRFSSQSIDGDEESIKEILNKVKDFKHLVMYHIGNEPPKFSELVKVLKKKDVITHAYHNKNNKFFDWYSQNPNAVKTDIGFGNESFSIDMMQRFIEKGQKPTSISTDIHNLSYENNKSCRLNIIMSLMMQQGMSIKEVVEATTTNPYKEYIGEDNYPEYQKIFTAFVIEDQEITISDSYSKKKTLNKIIKPIAMYKDGKDVWYE